MVLVDRTSGNIPANIPNLCSWIAVCTAYYKEFFSKLNIIFSNDVCESPAIIKPDCKSVKCSRVCKECFIHSNKRTSSINSALVGIDISDYEKRYLIAMGISASQVGIVIGNISPVFLEDGAIAPATAIG